MKKCKLKLFEKTGKRFRGRDRIIARLNEMVSEFENNDSSKFFIEEYRHFLKIDFNSAINEMMHL